MGSQLVGEPHDDVSRPMQTGGAAQRSQSAQMLAHLKGAADADAARTAALRWQRERRPLRLRPFAEAARWDPH